MLADRRCSLRDAYGLPAKPRPGTLHPDLNNDGAAGPQASRYSGETMAAYLLVDCEVTDPKQYDDYKRLAQAAASHNTAGVMWFAEETVVLEGTWKPNRVVVLEFPDLEQARRFYDSPEYRTARAAARRGTHEHGCCCRSLGSFSRLRQRPLRRARSARAAASPALRSLLLAGPGHRPRA